MVGWLGGAVGAGVQHLRTLHSDFAGLLAAATASLEWLYVIGKSNLNSSSPAGLEGYL